MRIVLLIVVIGLMTVAGLAEAATLIVTTDADVVIDEGQCSLREAMINAENADQSGSTDCPAGSASGNLIVFGAGMNGATILLSGEELPTVTRPLEIVGPVRGNPAALTIDAAAASRIFRISQANEVLIADLTLINGRTFSDGWPGAKIRITNNSVVRIERVWFDGGIAQGVGNNGGAIAVSGSDLRIEEAQFVFNQADGGGGAIFASNSQLELIDTTMGINVAVGRGGAVHAAGGDVLISNSQFNQNATTGDSSFGGALFLDGANLIMNDSMLFSNGTSGEAAHGGALYLRNAALAINGGLIQGNTVQGDGSNGGGISTFNANAFLSGGCQVRNNQTVQAGGWGGGLRIGNGDIEISNCVIAENQTAGDNAHGGGIYVIDGETLIENSQILANQTLGASAEGGGVRTRNGNLTVANSLVEGNATQGQNARGGGVYHRNGQVRIINTRIRDNQTDGAQSHGGGVYLLESQLEFSNGWVEGNLAGDAVGAGMALFGGDYLIENVTISSNQGAGSGGGMYVSDSMLLLTNSTLSANVLSAGTGAALYGARSEIEMLHATVANNVNPPGNASHVFLFGSEEVRASLELHNSLINDNRCGANAFATISGSGSLASHESCTGLATPVGALAILPLVDNGGYAPTHALDETSVAINAAGDCLAVFGIDEDQRGFTRPGGASSACDVGAYESDQPPVPVDLSAAVSITPTAAQVGQQLSVIVEVTNRSTRWASGVLANIDIGDALIVDDVDYDVGSYSSATELWAIGPLGPEETVVMQLTVTLTASGSREVVISVSGDQPDPAPGNNLASQIVLEVEPTATLLVDTLLDVVAADGLCSLREAMLNAENADQSGSTDCVPGGFESNRIEFHPDLIGGTIVLDGEPLPMITGSLEILGPVSGDPTGLVIDANELSRHLILDGADDILLADMTLTGGRAAGHGGSILIDRVDQVRLERLVLTDNATVASDRDGGAVWALFSGLTVVDSTLMDNEAAFKGGAIALVSSELLMTGSTVADNLALTNSGGIYAQASSGVVRNSTISGNRQTQSTVGQGFTIRGGEFVLEHVTFAFNQLNPSGAPSGLAVSAFSGTPALVDLRHSLIVGDYCGKDTASTLNFLNNLATRPGCGVEPVADAMINLSELADNGGPTLTRALGADSLAINAAGTCLPGLESDQRGQPRPGGSTSLCDAGAFEFQGDAPEADLRADISANRAAVQPGQRVTYSIEISQDGPAMADEIVAQIDWPAGLTFVSAQAAGSSFDSDTGLWTIGELATGDSTVLTLRLDAVDLGEQLVTVSVAGRQPDPNPANNTAMVSVDVLPPPEPIIVTTLADEVIEDGACSLREAIINANNNDQSGSTDCGIGSPFGDDILFDPALAGGHLLLSGTALPTVVDSVDIYGPVPEQADGLTIDGGGLSRLFRVDSADWFGLEGMTLTGGAAGADGLGGGAILVESVWQVDLRHVNLIDNQAQGPDGHGGALKLVEGAVDMRNCEVSGNVSAAGHGGAIFADHSFVSLRRCLLADNQAPAGSGGAIHADGSTQGLTLQTSTVSGNHAGQGGGIWMQGGYFWLEFVSLVDNSAGSGAADLVLLDPAQGLQSGLNYSLIAQTHGGTSCQLDPDTVIYPFQSLSTDADCVETPVSASALALGPLADNGGPTRTHALLEGSVAIDWLDNCPLGQQGGSGGGLTDQRGQPRPGAGSASCDAGAYEYQGQASDQIFRDRFEVPPAGN